MTRPGGRKRSRAEQPSLAIKRGNGVRIDVSVHAAE